MFGNLISANMLKSRFPLLEALSGDRDRAAPAGTHTWQNTRLPALADAVNDATLTNPTTLTLFDVDTGSRFRPGDQIMLRGKAEVMLVTAVNSNTLTVTRNYGGSATASVVDDDIIDIIGNASFSDEPLSTRLSASSGENYSQVFSRATTQKNDTVLLQDDLMAFMQELERTTVHGRGASTTSHRSMKGLIHQMTTNLFEPGSSPLPIGEGANEDLLTDELLNIALMEATRVSGETPNLIVSGPFQINRLTIVDGVYKSPFGTAKAVVSASMALAPAQLLLLNTAKIDLLPVRDIQLESGVKLIGEYTLEVRDEHSHALIKSLGTSLS